MTVEPLTGQRRAGVHDCNPRSEGHPSFPPCRQCCTMLSLLLQERSKIGAYESTTSERKPRALHGCCTGSARASPRIPNAAEVLNADSLSALLTVWLELRKRTTAIRKPGRTTRPKFLVRSYYVQMSLDHTVIQIVLSKVMLGRPLSQLRGQIGQALVVRDQLGGES